MNIQDEDLIVNKKNAILALKRLFYLQSKNKSVFSETVSDNGAVNYSILKPLGENIVNNCPFDVPMCFAPNGALKDKKDVERKSAAEKYPELFKEATQGEITNRTLRFTLNRWIKSLGNVCIKDINGYSFFESNAKGTARYNKRNYWKFHDFCKLQDSFGKKAYFCTFTCQYDVKKDNIINKWIQFSDELNLILKKLSSFYGVEYIGVKESFLSGYPHAHVIFYVKDFDATDKQRYLRSKKYSVVVDSKIKRLLNKHFTMGYTELVRNTKKGTSNYLSKYISKNETTGLKHIANKKKWNNSDRKQILTTFMPIVANVRQFQKSVKISDNHEKKFHFENFLLGKNVSGSKCEDIIQKSLFLSNADFIKKCRDSDYLIALCNNLPKCIQKQVCLLSNKTLWKFTSEPINKINGESAEYKKAIFSKSKCLTCSECVYSHFLAELLTHKDECFHKEEVNSVIPAEMSQSLVAEALKNLDKEDNKSIYSKEMEVFNSCGESDFIESIEQRNKTFAARSRIEQHNINVKQMLKDKENFRLKCKFVQVEFDKYLNSIYDDFVSGVKHKEKTMEVQNGIEQMLF